MIVFKFFFPSHRMLFVLALILLAAHAQTPSGPFLLIQVVSESQLLTSWSWFDQGSPFGLAASGFGVPCTVGSDPVITTSPGFFTIAASCSAGRPAGPSEALKAQGTYAEFHGQPNCGGTPFGAVLNLPPSFSASLTTGPVCINAPAFEQPSPIESVPAPRPQSYNKVLLACNQPNIVLRTCAGPCNGAANGNCVRGGEVFYPTSGAGCQNQEPIEPFPGFIVETSATFSTGRSVCPVGNE